MNINKPFHHANSSSELCISLIGVYTIRLRPPVDPTLGAGCGVPLVILHGVDLLAVFCLCMCLSNVELLVRGVDAFEYTVDGVLF